MKIEEHLIIVGNGVSGITLALETRRRSSIKITVISDESEFFYARTALMYIYIGQLKLEHTKPYEDWFWSQNNIHLEQDYVSKIDTTQKRIYLNKSEKWLTFSKLVLATGSKPKKLNLPNINAKGVLTFHNLNDLARITHLTEHLSEPKKAVIIGGGLIGVELAEMLRSRGIHVAQLVREESYWSNVLPLTEANMIANHMRNHGVNLTFNAVVESIQTNTNNEVSSVKLKNSNEIIHCNLVFLAIGVTPSIQFLENTNMQTNDGILVDEYLETNIKDIYAIGDCAEHKAAQLPRNSIEATWYTGKEMGRVLAQTITGNKQAYVLKFWYNSAKFFDIEYHTYGTVHNKPALGYAHFNWINNEKLKSITIEYEVTNRTVKGLNTFGIPMNQKIIFKWLDRNITLEYLVDHLKEASFNNEFEQQYHEAIKQELQKLNEH